MKKVTLLVSLLLMAFFSFAQQEDLKTKTIHLDNGLKVVMCEDHASPQIYGCVYVHAGSKNDPADATGMAHYFEHIMFKGTDKIGTTNWEAEKVYLDSISLMYDKLHETNDLEARKAIQRKINELSIASTDYAIPNETDVILTQMGGEGLNAGTSYDQTMYFNSFPANQLSKWMVVYVERFRNPIFRLFQSELETVYEEKNMYGDGPINAFQEGLFREAFGEHPYGRPVIGYTEHLKNPQPSKMREFYNTYYVANNMTLILVGDFNIEEIEPMVAEKFGTWRKGEIPAQPEYNMPEFEGKVVKEVHQTPIKVGTLIYPGVKANDPDLLPLSVACSIFSNGETGLMDKLMLNGDIMAAMLMPLSLEDCGRNVIIYIPKILGQKHEDAENMIFDCLDKLKKGEFSDDLFEAIRINMVKSRISDTESLESLANLFMSLEMSGQTYQDYLDETERMKTITKDEVVAVANKYFGDNYIAYRSKMGFPEKDKVEKPDWKPIEAKNTNEKSDFAKAIEAQQMPEVTPQVIKFGEDVKISDVNDNFKLYSTINTRNDIFNMNISYNYGNLADPDLERAIGYLEMQGTKDKSFEEFRLELQKLGANIYCYSSDANFSVQIEGFEKDLNTILGLCHEKLFNPSNDESKKKLLIEGEATNMTMSRDDAATWARAVREYALYGEKSTYLSKMPLKKWKKLSDEQLLAEVAEALKYDGHVTYSGNTAPKLVVNMLKENHLVDGTLKGKKEIRQPKTYAEPQVLVASSKKFRQSNIYFNVSGEKMNQRDKALCSVFNKYFGTDMYSIVFQEIREFRSLGYTARGYYTYDNLNRISGSLYGFLGTQSDKTIDGITAFRDLIVDMPEREEKFKASKEALIMSRASDYYSFRSKPFAVQNWMEQGYDHDPRAEMTDLIRTVEYKDIYDFYTRMIKDRPIVIMMSGNLKKINAKDLNQFGKVTQLKYKDIIKE